MKVNMAMTFQYQVAKLRKVASKLLHKDASF